MKKVKTNKLSLNKQTVTNLGIVKGGKVVTGNTSLDLTQCFSCACPTLYYATCPKGGCPSKSINYTACQSDACGTNNSVCYCG